MKTRVLSGLLLLGICGVTLAGVTVTPAVPFEKADQPHWQVDAAKGEAVYVPDNTSLETPTLILDSGAVSDSSLTLTIDSDAKKLQINGQGTLALDLAAGKHHTIFLSFKGADSTLFVDGRESSRHKGLWQAVVAANPEKIPLAFIGASYVTIHVETGTQPPAAPQPVVLVPAPAPVVLQAAPAIVIAAAPPAVQPFIMQGNGTLCADGSMILTDGQRLASLNTFSTPISFKIVAKTDSTNIRIGFPASQIIFNWEMNRRQLRIDGGPANGMHRDGAGNIPVNRWVTFDITVTPDTLVICVDGQERDRIHADFSRVNQPLTIFQAAHSTVTVKSVQAVAGTNAVPMVATFTTPAPRGVSFELNQRLEAAERARELQEAAHRAQLQQAAADARAQEFNRVDPRILSARIRVLQTDIDHRRLELQRVVDRGESSNIIANMQRTIDDLTRQLQDALNQQRP